MHDLSTSKLSDDPKRPSPPLVFPQPFPTSSRTPHEKYSQTLFGTNKLIRGSTTSLEIHKEAPVAQQGRPRTQSLPQQNSPSINIRQDSSSSTMSIARNVEPQRTQSLTENSPTTMSGSNLSWPMLAAQKAEPQSRPPLRRRILFYDWTRPYYCFSNFSPHPVKYKGKTYPTGEHLFQSFKASNFVCLARYDRNIEFSSLKIIDLDLLNIFGYAVLDQMTPFQKLVASNPKFGLIGWK